MASATPTLTDLQSAIVDYVLGPARGRPLAEIAAQLSSPGQLITEDDIRSWITQAGRPQRQSDPIREHDDERREAITEDMYREAAATIPGAADILGIERFSREATEEIDAIPGAPVELAAVVAKLLDFLVPEVAGARWTMARTSISIPSGGHHEVWEVGDGPRKTRTMRSTLAVYDACGILHAIHPYTRPRTQVLRVCKGASVLCVRQLRSVCRADLHAIAQRVLQVALEFRPGRHGAISQKELGKLVGRTKQAMSHQMGLVADKVIASTGGRAGFRRRRNVGGKKKEQPH